MFEQLQAETKKDLTREVEYPWHWQYRKCKDIQLCPLKLIKESMAALFGHSDIWNLSSDETFDELYRELGDEFLTASWVTGILVLCLTCPTASVGNGIVLAAISIDPLKKIRSAPSNHTIFNLALADFLTGSLASTLYSSWFIYFALHRTPPFSMTFALAINYVLVCTSVFSLVVLTIDRRIAITTPLQYTSKVTKKNVQIVNGCIWCYFIIIGALVAVFKNRIYVNAMIVSGHIFLAYCIIIVLNFLNVLSMHKQSRLMKQLSNAQSTTFLRKAQARERKLTRTAFILITVFTAMFWPFAVVQFFTYLCVPCGDELLHLTWLFLMTSVVVFFNAVVNPFLYALFLPKYKETFSYFVAKCNCYQSRNSNSESPEASQNSRSTSVRTTLDTKL